MSSELSYTPNSKVGNPDIPRQPQLYIPTPYTSVLENPIPQFIKKTLYPKTWAPPNPRIPALGLYAVRVRLNAQEGFQHQRVEGPLPRWKVHVGLRLWNREVLLMI